MSANDELRRLLDERGVEWEAFDDFEPTTQWSTHNGSFVYWAIERDGKLLVETTAPFKCSISCTHEQTIEACTPEQAIAATLGSCNCTNSERTDGTCKVDVLNTGDCAGYECSEYIMHCNGCGHEFGHVLYNEDGDVWMSEKPRYCPNCGRRVEVD